MIPFLNGLEFKTANIRVAALILRAINYELRMEILSLIQQSTNITGTGIYNALELEEYVASQHLAIPR
jgi:hypothetical protein